MPSAIAIRMYCVNLLDICDPPRFRPTDCRRFCTPRNTLRWHASTKHAALHLSRRERSARIEDARGVRDYGVSLVGTPSPGLLRNATSPCGRGEGEPRLNVLVVQ